MTALQALANRHPRLLAALRDALPAPLSALARRSLGPVRIPVPPDAWVPLDSIPRPAGGAPILPERTSVIVPVFNCREHVRLCLASLRACCSPCPEVIVVDDGSTDGTWPLLQAEAKSWPELAVLRLVETRGFAHAVNHGAAEASGEVLIFLNSDVVVTPGALGRIARAVHEDPGIGLASAATNDSGDEATVPAAYRTLDDLLGFAAQRARAHADAVRDIPKAALFCAAIRRHVFLEVGGLDEGYGRGMFEDDDLARCLARLGYRVCLVPGSFVHHYAGASFRTLPPAAYLEIFERSRLRFERKWG
ncbi:MAG: glycosyltransferase family 2 protein [Deltaproteobacteria bacterium]|nr:glycosyltransferase family 2 protein [Deltaproteobacteria bacterium]